MKIEELKVLISEKELIARIKELAQEFNKIYGNEEIVVICMLKGAVMFATELIKYLDMPLKIEFIRLSSYGSLTKTSGKVDAIDINLPDLNGKNVLVVEDIVDSGLTARFFIDYVNNNFNTKSFKFVSLLNKKIARKTDIAPDYYGFEVDDKFVVGFGLDYDGYFRNLPYIAYKD